MKQRVGVIGGGLVSYHITQILGISTRKCVGVICTRKTKVSSVSGGLVERYLLRKGRLQSHSL